MASDEMTNERLDQHDRRLDEHGVRLGGLDDRLNHQAARITRHEQILLGDAQLGVPGVGEQLKEISLQLKELRAWRDQVVNYIEATFKTITAGARIALILLTLIGAGVWWPQVMPRIVEVLKMIGG